MKTRQALVAAAMMVASFAAIVPASAQAAVDVNILIGSAPPPVRYEPVPAPRAGYVWAPGYWAWQQNRHVWQAGHWERARPGYRYAAPQWVRNGQGWRLERARWQAVHSDQAYHRGYQQGYREAHRDNKPHAKHGKRQDKHHDKHPGRGHANGHRH